VIHQRASRAGFTHADLLAGAKAVLLASTEALGSDPDVRFLEPLHHLLQHQITPAHRLVRAFRETNSIETVLSETYRAPLAPIVKT
jgi:hypothetical protein